MMKTTILSMVLMFCSNAWGQNAQTDVGSHSLSPPSWQTVTIVAVIAFALAAIGYFGTRVLKAMSASAYMQGAAPRAPESFNAFFLQSARIAIVGVIVMATVVLALFDKLDKGAIGVLSGVAGYVLGGADQNRKRIKRTGKAGIDSEPRNTS